MVDTLGWANSAPTPTTVTYNGRQLRQINAVGMAGATAARPLGARTGVRPGTSVTTVTATSTTWTCGPFGGLADVMLAAEASGYPFSFDAIATGAVTAANASFPRRDAIYVQIVDPENGATTPSAVRGYLAGTVNSGGTLVIAAVPAGAFVIAEINVPISGGGSPTVSWVAPYAVAAGAILPVSAGATPSGAFVGQYVDDAALGLLRWNGTLWQPSSLSAVSTVSGDGHATIAYSKLIRDTNNVVTATWRQDRTNATTYATSLIVGVIALPFRSSADAYGVAVTSGSRSPNQVWVNPANGVVTLLTASPAGHTVAQVNISYPII